MSSLRPGIASGVAFVLLSTGWATLPSGIAGCASTYSPPKLPPPPDFSVDGPDLASLDLAGAGGDLAGSVADLAGGGVGDLATTDDLATARDLGPACLDDPGSAPTLFVAAPAGGGLFAARLYAGMWTTVDASGAATDVALATVGKSPLVAVRLGNGTLAAARFDGCRGFEAPAAIAAAASTANRPALVGGASGDVVFRGSVSGDQRYYWSHFDGTNWGAIATQGNFLSTLPPTALRVGSVVHVVFSGTDTNLWDGVPQAAGGGSATQLSGNTSALAPAAALAGDGRLHVVYTGGNKHLYWFVAAAPATVHDLCDGQAAGCFIVSDAAPALAIGSDGAPTALFRGTDGKVYASRLTGTQWGAATLVSGNDTTSLAPAIAGGGSSALADVVYVREGDKALRHAQLVAAGWQAPVSIGTTAATGAPALTPVP
jgi:hypothetical protein